MHPELFRFGPVVVGSYGVMLAIAFMAGIYITMRLAERREIDRDKVLNLCFIILIAAIIGSRLLYVVTHLDEFQGRWLYTFLPVQPDGSIGLSGLIFLGGFIAALLAALVYVKKQNIPAFKMADSAAPALAFGLFVGRIGCFLNGCCFGKICDTALGVKFPAGSAAGFVMGDVYLHPTQLYSSTYGLIIFVILMLINYKKVADGLIAAVFLVLYGIARFTVDFFRYYEEEMIVAGGLDWNQIISLIMVIGGVILFFDRSRRAGKVFYRE